MSGNVPKAIGLSRREALIVTGAGLVAACTSGSQDETVSDVSVENQPSAAKWSTSPSLPFAAQEIYPCEHNGALHLAGGFVATSGRINSATAVHNLWRPGDADWTEATPLPVARHHPHMISYKGRLLALAGFEGNPATGFWIMQKSGWQLVGDEWQSIADLPAPCAEAVLAETGDGVLHMAGGRTPNGEANSAWTDQGDTDHHFVLSDLNGSWETAAPCPTKRNSTAGGVLGGNLHIVGGRTVIGRSNVDTHEVYDVNEDRWRTAAPMPQAQGGLAAASLGGKLYVFGGEFFNDGGGVYKEAWVYDPATDQWDSIPDMPNPRHGLGAVALGNAIYVIGGAKQASGVDTSELVEVFTPA